MSKLSIVVIVIVVLLVGGALFLLQNEREGGSGGPGGPTPVSRENSIPEGAVKVTPETDAHPPVLHSDNYEEPVPVPGPINTAGAEDSAFLTPDGKTLYFWFTPDVDVPAENQIVDGVTGIYVSEKTGGEWSEPERVVLQDEGKPALDGCVFVRGDEMWFCSTREGYTGMNFFTARYVDGEWTDWEYAGDKLNEDYELGEMHITSDGKRMYFHSDRVGGKGGRDIWMTEKANGEWQEPVNVEAVNSSGSEGLPFVTQDGDELWFSRQYGGTPAVFRSRKENGGWQDPELIVSTFAGEPSLDEEGNIYFIHHFFDKDGDMIEADVYVAMKR